MIRLFEKDSKQKIASKLYEELLKLKRIKSLVEFNEFHNNICAWFTENIKTAQKERDNKIIKTWIGALWSCSKISRCCFESICLLFKLTG